MAKHEFCIMSETPENERYDSYDPQKHECQVYIDDDYIEPLLPYFEGILCYCHTRLITSYNLIYCGITLIPPDSSKQFVLVFKEHNHGQYDELIVLFKKSVDENKYIIHYGL